MALDTASIRRTIDILNLPLISLNSEKWDMTDDDNFATRFLKQNPSAGVEEIKEAYSMAVFRALAQKQDPSIADEDFSSVRLSEEAEATYKCMMNVVSDAEVAAFLATRVSKRASPSEAIPTLFKNPDLAIKLPFYGESDVSGHKGEGLNFVELFCANNPDADEAATQAAYASTIKLALTSRQYPSLEGKKLEAASFTAGMSAELEKLLGASKNEHARFWFAQRASAAKQVKKLSTKGVKKSRGSATKSLALRLKNRA